MRKATLTLHTNEPFPIPTSTGYSLYGALLGKLQTDDAAVSKHIHDREFIALHNSGLLGQHGEDSFGYSNKKDHKQVRTDTQYRLNIGLIDANDIELFDSLAESFLFDDSPITLTSGNLYVDDFTSRHATYSDLIESAREDSPQALRLTFKTLTGIKEHNEVTTAFPHRRSVFRSLLRRWNRNCPEDQTLALTEADIEQNLIEKPQYAGMETPITYDTDSEASPTPLRTDSVVTKSLTKDNGGEYYHQLQGFKGTCDYQFKQTDEKIQTELTALAKFAEFAGVGAAVSRGCGHTNVEVIQ